MKFFKNFDWSLKSIAKVFGAVLGGLFLLTLIIALFSFSFRTVFKGVGSDGDFFAADYGMGKAVQSEAAPAMTLSKMIPPQPDYSEGDDAEKYEVVSYSATIKTRSFENDCKKILDLKSKDYVIFENSSQGEENCYFSFKVKKENEKEILNVIKALDPDDLYENIQTIKGTIDYYDDRLTILKNKLESIEDTLESAQESYDEIQDLATKKQDVESLAVIISNRLDLIEKLSKEKISVKEQIDNYNLNKADQLDRLNYSFFNVNIYKDNILNWKDIKDNWKYELKLFVNNLNDVVQGISVNLVYYLIVFVQLTIYLLISVFLLKFVWAAVKRIWKGKGKRR